MSLQNSFSCDFQVFRRFSMKSTNLNTVLSRSNYTIVVFLVQNQCIFVDFHDFDDFCSGPVQDFSQNDQVSERS